MIVPPAPFVPELVPPSVLISVSCNVMTVFAVSKVTAPPAPPVAPL